MRRRTSWRIVSRRVDWGRGRRGERVVETRDAIAHFHLRPRCRRRCKCRPASTECRGEGFVKQCHTTAQGVWRAQGVEMFCGDRGRRAGTNLRRGSGGRGIVWEDDGPTSSVDRCAGQRRHRAGGGRGLGSF